MDTDTGEVLWQSPSTDRVRGSGSSLISANAHWIDDRPYLRIDGNPAKFFQGHNVVGTDDPALIWRFGRVVTALVGADRRGGDWYLNRVDINRLYRVGSGTDNDATRWLRAAEKSASVRHRGRGTLQAGTWYVGQRSKRWTLKAYAKGVEMRSKRPRGYSLMRSPSWAEAVEFATGCVRIELCVRRPELVKLKLRHLRKWSRTTAGDVFDMYVARLDLPNNTPARVDLSDLSPAARGVWLAWKAGEHLPALLSRAAYYRWRRYFRDEFGVDIGTDPLEGGDVVPLISTLSARQVESPPGWCYQPSR